MRLRKKSQPQPFVLSPGYTPSLFAFYPLHSLAWGGPELSLR